MSKAPALPYTWLGTARIPVDSVTGDITEDLPLDLQQRLLDADVIFLGETNHFVHEKVPFRVGWLKWLSRYRPLVVAEELGWADGRRVAGYLFDDDDGALRRAGTFGGKDYERLDRDDLPKGIFGQAPYPHALMRAEHTRLYLAMRGLPAVSEFYGFDIDNPGGAGYVDILRYRNHLPAEFVSRLEKIEGESIDDEVARLEPLLSMLSHAPPILDEAQLDLLSMIESLRYTKMVQHAMDYQAVGPAMAYREETMKRRIDAVLDRMPVGAALVMMGHAYHLAKNDTNIPRDGVGTGDDEYSSLGHYLSNERNLRVASIWMVYGRGEDSQPLPDLTRQARYAPSTLNTRLLRQLPEPTVLTVQHAAKTDGWTSVGHLYGTVAEVNLVAEADAITFFPEVTPLMP